VKNLGISIVVITKVRISVNRHTIVRKLIEHIFKEDFLAHLQYHPYRWRSIAGLLISTMALSLMNISLVMAQPKPQKGSRIKSIQLLHTLTGHDNLAFGGAALAITPDGRTLVSAARDGKIILWDLKSGVKLRQWIGDKKGVSTLSISPDGQTILSGGIESNVKAWSFPSGQIIFTISGHTAPVSRILTFSEPSINRQLMVSASDDSTIQVWQLGQGIGQQILVSTLTIKGYTSDLLLTPDYRYVIINEKSRGSGRHQPKIHVWDWKEKKVVRQIAVPSSEMDSLAVTPDGKYLIGGSFGQLATKDRSIHTLKLWNLATGKIIYEFPDNSSSIESIILSKNGKYLLAGTYDGRLKVWDLQTRKLVSVSRSYGKVLDSLKKSSDGKTLVGSLDNGKILIWQLVDY
jgi:COMPASS component SWD3